VYILELLVLQQLLSLNTSIKLKKPESSSYTSSGITTFKYVTNSATAVGPINEIDVTFPGVDYEKSPGIST
jgi:hypothetical protein